MIITIFTVILTYHGKQRNRMPETEHMRVRVLQSSTAAARAEKNPIPRAKHMLKRIPQKLLQSVPTSS